MCKWRVQARLLFAIGFVLALTLLHAFSGVTADVAPQYHENLYIYLPLTIREAEWLAWIGPDGGSITALAIDPQHPEVIYAGTWGAGIYKTMDAGASWHSTSRGLRTLYINSLAINPRDPQVLLAGTYKGKLYQSVDAGDIWFLSSQGIQDEAIVYDIAIDPTYPQNVYIATRGISNLGLPPWSGIVYKSTDSGNIWVPSLTDVGSRYLQDWIYSLSIHPWAPNIIFAAAHEQGPYRSMNAGASWEVVENGVTDNSGRAIVIEPRSRLPAVAYFGVWHGGGVFKTMDGGERWYQVSDGVFGNKVFSIEIDPLEMSTLYLGTFTAGVMKTINGGVSWGYSGLYDEAIFSLGVNPLDPNVVYAGTVGNGLFRSVDAGTTWSPSNQGLRGSPLTSFVVDRLDQQTYYTSNLENGVLISTDHGNSWMDYNTNLPERVVTMLVPHPSQPDLLFALTGSSGLYRRQVAGSDGWILLGEGLPEATNLDLKSELLVAAYPDMLSEPFSVEQTATYVPLLVIAFTPGEDTTVYLGTQGAGVYKSLNGGVNCEANGLSGETVRSLMVDFNDPQVIYAATEQVGGLYASEDGGLTWSDGGLPERMIHAITQSQHFDHAIYLSTDDGVYRLTDTGWKQTGLSGLDVQMIAVHPVIDDWVYAATKDGAYLSRDGGLSWHLLLPELSDITMSDVSIDPHNPQVIYFITPTRGILRAHLPNGN